MKVSKKQMCVYGTLLIFVIMIVSMPQIQASPDIKNSNSIKEIVNMDMVGKYLPVENPDKGAEQVTIGLYPINIYDLSYESNTYSMSAYLWYTWQGDIDPTETLELTNVVDEWGLTKNVLTSTPILLPDGRKYQCMRINGTFYQKFDLNAYPLERQRLSLYVEDTTNSIEQIYYQPDTKKSGYDATLSITGWRINKFNSQKYLHDYVSDFGDISSVQNSKYSALEFSVEIERNRNYFIWKAFLPLCIILLTNWLALILDPDKFCEPRTYMPATALLTLIFLQISSFEAIPQVGYLTLMDKEFILSYILVLTTLIQVIVFHRKLKENTEENSLILNRIVRVDKISFAIQVVVFITVTSYLIINR